MRSKIRGLSGIEALIIIAMVAIIGAVIVPLMVSISSAERTNISTSWGLNGPVEVRCIAGYKYVVTPSHLTPATQMIDSEGRAIACKDR